jgi:hypothetical protein
MNHDELRDFLAPHALGVLKGEERAALREHLEEGCPECRSVLADFQGAALALAGSVPVEAPPARVKAMLMKRISAPRPLFFRNLVLAAGACVALGVAGFFWHARGSPAPRVAGLTGTLLADGRPLGVGDSLPWGSLLILKGEGTADLRFGSRALFRLKHGAEAVVWDGEDGLRILLNKGGVLSRVKTGFPFAVQTPVVGVRARGTVFYVQADAPMKTHVCLCRGKIHLEAPGFSRDLEADHHFSVDLLSEASRVRSAPSGMVGHMDQDVAEIETLRL